MEQKTRISTETAMALVATAVLFDVIQAFFNALLFAGVVLNLFVNAVAWMTFWLWFRMLGVAFLDSTKRFAVMAGGVLIEFVPLLNTIPAWTLSVAILSALVKTEDALRKRRAAPLLP